MVVMVNDKDSRFTGTSGTIAWELQEENVHLIVMWSIPYNLRVYNSYFGIGVVQLSTRYRGPPSFSLLLLSTIDSQVQQRHVAILVQTDD